jgi:4'-phosphopantetheinyl transferase
VSQCAALEPFTVHSAEVVLECLDVNVDALRAATTMLSRAERDRAGRYVFDRDRNRFVVARARLRQLLAARLGIQPHEVEFTLREHGKPALGGRFSSVPMHFNLSHAEGTVAFVVSECEVGIDIEAVRTLHDADSVVARMFSRAEAATYFDLHHEHRSIGFFNCWTRKEAFVKAVGTGLRHDLGSFDVSLRPGEPARILRVGQVPGERCGWSLHSFTAGSGLIGAVVTRTQDVPA